MSAVCTSPDAWQASEQLGQGQGWLFLAGAAAVLVGLLLNLLRCSNSRVVLL
jgi:hypothetical protein